MESATQLIISEIICVVQDLPVELNIDVLVFGLDIVLAAQPEIQMSCEMIMICGRPASFLDIHCEV